MWFDTVRRKVESVRQLTKLSRGWGADETDDLVAGTGSADGSVDEGVRIGDVVVVALEGLAS